MKGWLTSWLAALRMSRRELLRHKSRNALIVAMLMLPVFGATLFETVLDSSNGLSTQEQLTRKLGGADAFVVRADTKPVYQDTTAQAESLPTDWQQQSAGGDYTDSQPTNAQLADAGAIRAALPHATLLPETQTWGVYTHGPAGYATPEYLTADYTNPALAGAFDLLAGRVPHTAAEADLSPDAMTALGAGIGSTVTLPASAAAGGKAADFTVVGELRQPGDIRAEALFTLPSAAAVKGQDPIGWFVLNPGGVDWSEVQTMNENGYAVTSREVVLDPPPVSQVPYVAVQQQAHYGADPNAASKAAVVALGVGIALLEVVLLAGPAFAVSARRREREYAIIGAAGANGSHLRRIVLADGLMLGALAGVLGAGLGFGAGAAVLPWFADSSGALPGHVHADPVRVVGVAVLAMLLGLCAAWAPARTVARRDIVASLAGRRAVTTRRVRVRRLATGIVLVAAGLCGVLFGRQLSPGSATVLVVAGIAVMEIGAIMCTPAVVGALARCGRILPLGPRLALRDSARNTGRTTPAVAAMFAAVAGAVAAGGWLDSALTQGRETYLPALLPNQVAVASVPNQQQAVQLESKLNSIMPVTGRMVIQGLNGDSGGDGVLWQVSALQADGSGGCASPGVASVPNSAQLTGCGSSFFGTGMAQQTIGGPAVLKEVTGIDDPRAVAALDQGGAVVFDSREISGGKATLVVQKQVPDKSKPGTATVTTSYVTVPAVYENPQGIPNPGLVISPAAAQRTGLASGGNLSLLLDLRSHVTASQSFAANQVISKLGNQSGLTEEDGYVSQLGAENLVVLGVALLLAFGAAAIATGLALADGRADQETLAAVGGSPWTRRWLAGSTALVITGLGVLIGIPVGFAISEGLVRVSNMNLVISALSSPGVSKPFTVPWLNLAVCAFAVPALTALGAALLSRTKAPSARRVDF